MHPEWHFLEEEYVSINSVEVIKEWNECNLLSNEIKKQMSTMDLVWISL